MDDVTRLLFCLTARPVSSSQRAEHTDKVYNNRAGKTFMHLFLFLCSFLFCFVYLWVTERDFYKKLYTSVLSHLIKSCFAISCFIILYVRFKRNLFFLSVSTPNSICFLVYCFVAHLVQTECGRRQVLIIPFYI